MRIDIDSLNDVDYEIFLSKYGDTIKEKSYYTDRFTGKIYHRSVKEIYDRFWYLFNEQDKGKFRQDSSNSAQVIDGCIFPEGVTLSEYQTYWYSWLYKYNPTYFITINLPFCMKDGFKRTKDHDEAKRMYRTLIREFEYLLVGSNRWKKEPVKFKGLMEKSTKDKGFYHAHLFLIDWNPSHRFRSEDKVETKLDFVAEAIRKRHNFFKTVFNIRKVYFKPGLLAYMVKPLKKVPAEQETSYLFDLKTWFNIDWEEETETIKYKEQIDMCAHCDCTVIKEPDVHFVKVAKSEEERKEPQQIYTCTHGDCVVVKNLGLNRYEKTLMMCLFKVFAFVFKVKRMLRIVSNRLICLSMRVLLILNTT